MSGASGSLRWDPVSVRAALESAPLADAPVAMIAVDPATNGVMACNSALASGLGVPTSEVAGRPLTSLVPRGVRSGVAEMLRRVAEGDPVAARMRVAFDASEALTRELRGRLVGVSADDGSPALVLGCFHFAEPTPSTFEGVEWEEPETVPVTHGSPLVLLADSQWRIRSVCAGLETVLGADAAELVGRPIGSLVHPDDLPDVAATAAEAVLTRLPPSQVKMRLLRSDGRRIDVAGSANPVLGGDNGASSGVALTLFPLRDPASGLDDLRCRMIALEGAVERLTSAIEGLLPEGALHLGLHAGLRRRRSDDAERTASDLPGLTTLSGREIEVLDLMADGYRVSTIARELFVSASTVRNHLSAIFRKLGVSSQAELLERLRRESGEQQA